MLSTKSRNYSLGILVFLGISLAVACNQRHSKEYVADEKNLDRSLQYTPAPEASQNEASLNETSLKKADVAGNKLATSSAAVVDKERDKGHAFIRKADLKFKTQNVSTATYAIEDITASHKGFVTYTKLESNIDRTETVAISTDSSLEATYYTTVNTMEIRVPNVMLDTTLKDIAKWIDYLDYRTITANDVSLSILSNQLTRQRMLRNGQRLTNAIDNRGRRLNETISGEDQLLNSQEAGDDAMLSNLSLKDQVDYSTINLTIYQRAAVKREMIANAKNIEAYEMGFGAKLGQALKSGWWIFETIIIGAAHIWVFLLLGVVIWQGIRWYTKRNRNNPPAKKQFP